jgi:hypothetical protein
MGTWTVHWTADGYVDIEADGPADATVKFGQMSFTEIREMGDYERPEVYYVEAAPEDEPKSVVPIPHSTRVVQLPDL